MGGRWLDTYATSTFRQSFLPVRWAVRSVASLIETVVITAYVPRCKCTTEAEYWRSTVKLTSRIFPAVHVKLAGRRSEMWNPIEWCAFGENDAKLLHFLSDFQLSNIRLLFICYTVSKLSLSLNSSLFPSFSISDNDNRSWVQNNQDFWRW